MSNTQVGNVYQQIIADVVESSRVDFEEGGVDEQVLEELKRGWQQKLSQLGVATFPWDPKPEPQPISNPPMVPSNAGNYQHLGAQPHSQAPYVAQNHNAGPRIKPEPGLESPTGGQPAPFPQTAILPPSATQAQQRAAAQIHNQFGNRAAASISAIQGSMSQQQHQQNPQNMQQIPQQHSQQAYQQQQQQAYNARMQQPQQGQQGGINGGQGRGQPLSEAQYRQAMAAQAAQAQHRLQVQNGVTGAQNDGAGDEMEESATVIKRMNANGEEVMGRIEIDNLMRAKIAAMGQSMEGGGLMLPLHQATNSQKRQRKVKKSSSGPGQQDGPGSDDDENKELVKDEELDEDAINSDLDDPEDGLNDDDDDDEGMGHIMLCMYDKVQRVKNKWKCVMKDGVLTVNQKEYVFHKASGEYEW